PRAQPAANAPPKCPADRPTSTTSAPTGYGSRIADCISTTAWKKSAAGSTGPTSRRVVNRPRSSLVTSGRSLLTVPIFPPTRAAHRQSGWHIRSWHAAERRPRTIVLELSGRSDHTDRQTIMPATVPARTRDRYGPHEPCPATADGHDPERPDRR